MFAIAFSLFCPACQPCGALWSQVQDRQQGKPYRQVTQKRKVTNERDARCNRLDVVRRREPLPQCVGNNRGRVVIIDDEKIMALDDDVARQQVETQFGIEYAPFVSLDVDKI